MRLFSYKTASNRYVTITVGAHNLYLVVDTINKGPPSAWDGNLTEGISIKQKNTMVVTKIMVAAATPVVTHNLVPVINAYGGGTTIENRDRGEVVHLQWNNIGNYSIELQCLPNG